MLAVVDEGAPISYEVLEKGVPVLAVDGEQVGNVYSVLADAKEDIFHGLVVDVHGHGKRVVLAEDVASLHERGVDLKLGAEEVAALPPLEGGAPVYDEDPGESKGWEHWMRFVGLRGDWKRQH
jgi:hypothetical protein